MSQNQFHFDPDTYLEMIRAEVPRFNELQGATVGAIEGEPVRILELGVGTGVTTRHILERFPEARITGLDASPDMVFKARELGIEVKLARIEDPLPDGPWDLVVSVLTVHHLDSDHKRDLFRRVREQSKALVFGDVVAVDPKDRVTPIEPGFDFPDPAGEQAEWCDGEILWSADDLAVIRASYS